MFELGTIFGQRYAESLYVFIFSLELKHIFPLNFERALLDLALYDFSEIHPKLKNLTQFMSFCTKIGSLFSCWLLISFVKNIMI